MRSDDAWLEAHRSGGLSLENAGWATATLGGASALLPATGQSWTAALPMTAVGIVLVGATYGGVCGFLAAWRVRRRRSS